jgi:hypothetical protein
MMKVKTTTASKSGRFSAPPTPLPEATRAGQLDPASPAEELARCPVKADAEQVVTTGQDFVKALRRLKRSLNACRTCPLAEDCPILSNLNAQVVAAITQVNIEWGML